MRALPDRVHAWDVSPPEAIAIQQKLRGLVQLAWQPTSSDVRRVAGVDVSVKKGLCRAAAVVLSLPELEPLDVTTAQEPASFPYIPGLLSFREGPVVLKALDRLRVKPDLLIFDGQGVAHPRRLGIAAHVGVLVDWPSVGCAKSRLCGQHDAPQAEKGHFALLRDDDEIIGAVVRTRARVRPVYVSVGHRIDLDRAIACVLGCCTRYRLPEPIRWAHRAAGGDLSAAWQSSLRL
jgi:deoxyribonuclease V